MASNKTSNNNLNGSKSYAGNTASPTGKACLRSWLLWAILITYGLVVYALVYFGNSNVQWYRPQPAPSTNFTRNVSSTRVLSSNSTQVLNATSNPITEVLLSTSKPNVNAMVLPSTSAAQVPNPTSTSNSFFYIRNPKASYTVCDQLELYIESRDGKNKRKTRGGDHMWPFLRTASLHASAPADELIDHGNGTFTARFTLHWTGAIEPLVRLSFSAEHADYLRNIRERAPMRFAYDAMFTNGNTTVEITPCHIDRDVFVDKRAVGLSLSSKSEVCDFSNRTAGTTWYCLKPKTLTCSNFTQHRGNLKRGREYVNARIRRGESSVVGRPGALKNTGKLKIVTVISNVSDATCMDLPTCTFGLPPKQPNHAAGFYFKDSWRSKLCRAREFHPTDTLKCLSNRSLYFYGDSTLRQWFEYLATNLGKTMKEEAMGASNPKVGPRRARDTQHNITMFFRLHEYPIRSGWVNVTDIKFTVSEIDGLEGGADTVVAFALWAHFTPTNLTYYRSRLEHIRDALARLQKRGTGTSPIFFKSANTMNSFSVENNDLFAYDLDQMMRAVFADVPDVAIIDVWDMTLSHRSGYHIHPVKDVIREEVKMFLNFLCETPSV
ncbi:NXPE family member 3-like [Patiria miniata]|uniref:NXPE C-terminal domain-containing protein n=1 Tax=Patiria miniata TaxID=46514 RepID=A0A914BDF2_PATMI|nr:NXPE family member 3-like [Patiria miniata]